MTIDMSDPQQNPYAPPKSFREEKPKPPPYEPKIPLSLLSKIAFRHTVSKTRKWGPLLSHGSTTINLINMFSLQNKEAQIVLASIAALTLPTLLLRCFRDPVTTQKFEELEDQVRKHLSQIDEDDFLPEDELEFIGYAPPEF